MLRDLLVGLRTFRVDARGARVGGGDWVQGGIAVFTDLFAATDPPPPPPVAPATAPAAATVHGLEADTDKELMVRIGHVRILPTSNAATATAAAQVGGVGGGWRAGAEKEGVGAAPPTPRPAPASAEVLEITSVRLEQAKRVTEGRDYVDVERLHGRVARVCLRRVAPASVRLLLVLQEVANAVPSSRFSHLKRGTAAVDVDHFSFSAAPTPLPKPMPDAGRDHRHPAAPDPPHTAPSDTYTYDDDVNDDMDMEEGGGGGGADELVCVRCTGLHVALTARAPSDPPTTPEPLHVDHAAATTTYAYTDDVATPSTLPHTAPAPAPIGHGHGHVHGRGHAEGLKTVTMRADRMDVSTSLRVAVLPRLYRVQVAPCAGPLLLPFCTFAPFP